MKKMAMLILIIMLCVSLVGCGKEITISLPFDSTNVNNVEMYHYIVPSSAEKKVITETDDITKLYSMFSELKVSDKKTEPVAGEDIISFRFNLSDATSYEIIYCADAVKAGRLKFPMEQLDYLTSADMRGCWDIYIYEVVTVNEDELPTYE